MPVSERTQQLIDYILDRQLISKSKIFLHLLFIDPDVLVK